MNIFHRKPLSSPCAVLTAAGLSLGLLSGCGEDIQTLVMVTLKDRPSGATALYVGADLDDKSKELTFLQPADGQPSEDIKTLPGNIDKLALRLPARKTGKVTVSVGVAKSNLPCLRGFGSNSVQVNGEPQVALDVKMTDYVFGMCPAQTNPLYGVWGSGANDVWMVGDSGSIVRWNGSTLIDEATSSKEAFQAVWGSGPNNVWVVGNGGTLIYSCNGTKRTISPDELGIPKLPKYGLASVHGTSQRDVWVVGEDASGSVLRPVVIHIDGGADCSSKVTGTLIALASPPTGANTSWLNAVFVRGSRVWAVGVDNNMQDNRLLLRYNGSTFTTLVPPGQGTIGLTTLAGSAGGQELWTAGFSNQMVRFMDDGTSATAMTLPNPAGDPQNSTHPNVTFWSVWGADPQRAYAVGTRSGLLEFIASNTPPWQVVPRPEFIAPDRTTFFSVWGVPDPSGGLPKQMWLVGRREPATESGQSVGVIYHFVNGL